MQPNSLSSEPPLILCVDDDPVVLTQIEAGLRSRGYEVLTAADGLSAVELFTCANVSAVVLDCEMPGVNGVQVARKLRHMNSRVPQILFSSPSTLPPHASQLVDDTCWKSGGLGGVISRVQALVGGNSSSNATSLNAHIAVASFAPEWEATSTPA